MRITKKTLRQAKLALRHRFNEISAIAATDGLEAEYTRVYPAADSSLVSSNEKLRWLLWQALDDAIPDHWID